MSSFLLFDRADRLVATAHVPTVYGDRDPRDVFRDAEPGQRGLEIHPAILSRIRPTTFDALVNNATIVDEGLRVDSIWVVEKRARASRLLSLERELVSVAREFVLLDLAGDACGRRRRVVDAGLEELRARMDELKAELARVEEGLVAVDPGKILRDLAGKILPL